MSESNTGAAGERLQALIDKIERLEAEKAALQDDIKGVYAEAKGEGFDVKTIRRIIAIRKLSEQEIRERADLQQLYMAALGMNDIFL